MTNRSDSPQRRVLAAADPQWQAVAGLDTRMRAPRAIQLVVVSAALVSFPACGRAILELFPDGARGTGDDARTAEDAGPDALDEDARPDAPDAADAPAEDVDADSGLASDATSLADVVGDTLAEDHTDAESGALHPCPPCPSSTPYCDTTTGACVECIGNPGDCSGGEKCNQISNSCELPCSTNSDCTSPDLCDPRVHLCADCLMDSDCQSAPELVCFQDTCVQCKVDSTCGTGHCKNFTCVDCLTTTDCPSGQTCVANKCNM